MTSVIDLNKARKKREKSSDLDAKQALDTVSELAGRTPTDEQGVMVLIALTVLAKAWYEPFTTKSDFAREHADFVAMCASEGYITTKVDEDAYGNKWVITQDGIAAYHGLKGNYYDPEG